MNAATRPESAYLNHAVEQHDPVAVYALFSGGHDSLAATALTAKHPRFTAAAFINTGTGIPRTVEFVRETCREQGWPLVELAPDGQTYEDVVREYGFGTGPAAHSRAYFWLKKRQVRRLVREAKGERGDRVLLATGVRRSESVRRMNAGISVPIRREGAQVWVNPILDWTGKGVSDFIDAEGLDRNPVVDVLHRSGECLCGTLFNKGDRDEVLLWAPEMVERIAEWERIAREAGHHNCVWGMPGSRPIPGQGELFDSQPLCVSCEARVA